VTPIVTLTVQVVAWQHYDFVLFFRGWSQSLMTYEVTCTISELSLTDCGVAVFYCAMSLYAVAGDVQGRLHVQQGAGAGAPQVLRLPSAFYNSAIVPCPECSCACGSYGKKSILCLAGGECPLAPRTSFHGPSHLLCWRCCFCAFLTPPPLAPFLLG